MTSLFGWEEANHRQKDSKGRFRPMQGGKPELNISLAGTEVSLIVSTSEKILKQYNCGNAE